ncbi:MAG: serpin family protein, partial [Phycisphaeraceae bacterium]|nr:serpin family protein [Phycisphaeraceae bacterium]
ELLAATRSAEGVTAPTKVAVKANSDFAFDLWRKLAEEKGNADKNLFFSPYSISSALTMVAEGARGQTAREMGSVLGFPKAALRVGADAQSIPWRTALIHSGQGELNRRFNREKKPYKLHVANALWGEQTYRFRPAYLAALKEPYGAALHPADFSGNVDGERQRINQWVEQQTSGRIKKLIPDDVLDTDTRLVLTNAIFFKGDWLLQFDKKQTRTADFDTGRGKVKVKMMSVNDEAKAEGEKEHPFAYAKFDAAGKPVRNWRAKPALQVLEMPYKGRELSMIVMLPEQGGLEALQSSLTASKLAGWIGHLRRGQVKVAFPKFKMETSLDLVPTLKAMGMPSAFKPGGFTGISDEPTAYKLAISDVLHKAFVEVTEEGTEAAAATAVVVKDESASFKPVFRADRPFLFVIRENATGTVLFCGRVMNPSGGK